MDMEEYKKVSMMDYTTYFRYLSQKYGMPKNDYTPFANLATLNSDSFKESRERLVKDGLSLHHFYECYVASYNLGMAGAASCFPPQYQARQNLCFCDWLEHFYLHILIGEFLWSQAAKEAMYADLCGNDVAQERVPQINDALSGRYDDEHESYHMCALCCKGHEDVYLELIKRFKAVDREYTWRDERWFVCSGYNKKHPDPPEWDIRNNIPLFEDIAKALGVYLNTKRIK